MIARNFISMASGQAAAAALAFAATVYLARTLDPVMFGALALGQTVAGYLALFSDMGVHIAGVNRIAAGSDVRGVVSTVSGLRVILAAAVFSCAALVFAAIGRPWAWTWPMLVFMLSIFPQALFLDWAYRGMRRMGSTAAAVLLKSAVFAAAALLLVRGPSDLVEAAWAWTVSVAVMSMALWAAFARDRGLGLPAPRTGEWKPLLAAGVPLGLSFILLQLYQNLNVLMIGVLRTGTADVEMAFYSAASRIVLFFLFVAGSFGFALHPVLAAAREGRTEPPVDVPALVSGCFRFCLRVSVPVAVCGTLLSGEIIAFVYGPEYAPAADALAVIVWQVPLVFAGVSFAQVLLAFGGGRRVLAAAAAAFTLNTALGLALIPGLGLTGAAVSVVAAECAMQGLLIAFAWRKAPPAGYAPSVAACALASGAMAATALLCGGHVIPRIAASAAAYVAVLGALEAAMRMTRTIRNRSRRGSPGS